MEFERTVDGDVAYLALKGLCDSEGRDERLERIVDEWGEAGVGGAVLNLSQLQFASSEGIAIFLWLYGTAGRKGVRVVYSDVPRLIASMMQAMGLDQMFRVFSSDAEATDYLRTPIRDFRESPYEGPMPKGVGYWVDNHSADLPKPQSLVRFGWQIDNLSRIVSYLASGHYVMGWMGHAECRFSGCGEFLGSGDLTDGEWLWPQGLEHYLLKHSVCLPERFIETMQSNRWSVPEVPDLKGLEFLLVETRSIFGDVREWVAWARQAEQTRPP